MELEQRVEELEREVKTLKNEIQRTLADIRECLPDKPAAPANWQKKAWALALLNVLLAVSLFANIYVFIPGRLPLGEGETSVTWLRAFWIAIAFIWLLLQLYPLALLLEQEDRQWQGVIWRNAAALLRVRPSVWVFVTFAVLIVALINAVFPEAWLAISLVMLVGVSVLAIGHALGVSRREPHPRR
ncbi:MAG TPA: hypothetical protein VIK33_17945 [Anaerolineae bacterium]